MDAAALARELELHPVVAAVLIARGFTDPDNARRFLNPSLEDLQSPFAFSQMRQLVDRVRSAARKKEKILVYGDYDVDGVTASAILAPALERLGADVRVHLPHRLKEGYGLNTEVLKRYLAEGITLVITVDNGITSLDAVRFLKDSGVDAILIDHHLPKGEMPPAFAIISAAVERGADPNLAACGLAFKAAWALLGNFESVREYLDLVTVGTIADLAPVDGENRILLKYGMPELAKTKRVGLKALMQAARIHPPYVSYRDIAFGLGPRINASGRMGSPETAYNLLTTSDPAKAREWAEFLENENAQRQKVEAEAYEEAVKIVEREGWQLKHRVLVVDSPGWHEGVLGIVASRLVDRFRVPAIVIASKVGAAKGSGRSVPGVAIFERLAACSELLESFGGHAQACGLTITTENISMLRERLNISAAKAPADTALRAVDGEIALKELTVSFLRDLERLAPFGPGNEKPLFLSRGVKLKTAPKKRGRDTLQCWVTDAETASVTCEGVAFRSYERWRNAPVLKAMDVVHQPVLKHLNGIEFIQLEIEDWRS